jgi:NAD+ synthase (glutamine-hydrolysing)
MPNLRLALAQFDFPVGAIARDEARIVELIAEARDLHKADLVLFPELALCGYPPEDLLLRPWIPCATANVAIRSHRAGRPTASSPVVGWPESAGAVIYNAASVMRDGAHRNAPIASASCRTTQSSTSAVISPSIRTARLVRVRSQRHVNVGLLICEDLWFAEPLADTVAQKPAPNLVVVAERLALRARQEPAQRDTLLADARGREPAWRLPISIVVGGQDELVFDGGSIGTGRRRRRTCIRVSAAPSRTTGWWPISMRRRRAALPPVALAGRGRRCAARALAYRAIVRGTRDYLRKKSFQIGCWIGTVGRHRFRTRAGHRGGCDRRRQRHRRCGCPRATPRTLATTWPSEQAADARRVHLLTIRDRGAVPAASSRSAGADHLPVLRRRCVRGKPAVALPRRDPDGAVEQARRTCC